MADNEQNGEKEVVSKADHEKALQDKDARAAKLEQDLEDVRMEVLTPEYQQFLNASKAGDKKEPAATDDTISDDKLEKMSKKEILEKAAEIAEKKLRGEIDKVRDERKADRKADTEKEVSRFASEHPEDYPTYRPIMYGLSLDPKHKNDSLSQLLKAAKEHVKNIHAEPSEKEKEKQRKSSGEKPTGDSKSFDELKNMTADEAAKEALAETKSKLGVDTFPTS